MLSADSWLTTLARVWMPSQGREGAIYLFGQHGAGKLVRIGHRRKGKQHAGAFAPLGREAVGAADYEDEIAGVALGALDYRGERIERLSRRVERDDEGGRVLPPRIGAGGAQLGHLC